MTSMLKRYARLLSVHVISISSLEPTAVVIQHPERPILNAITAAIHRTVMKTLNPKAREVIQVKE